ERTLRLCIIHCLPAHTARALYHVSLSDKTGRPWFVPRLNAVVMSRPVLAQINLAAMRKNLRVAREKSAGAQLLAVVKANAYGHGLLRVLPAFSDADGFALLELDAAVLLREHHYARRILLLEGF